MPRPLPWLGIAAGLLYGAFIRLLFASKIPAAPLAPLTYGFIAGVPFGLGFLQVWLSERDRRQSWLARIFAPWIPALICLAAALLLAWEGLICVALLTPIALVMASVGGLCAGLLRRRFGGSHPGAMLACCLALPLIVSPLEQFRQPERQIRTVATAIAIDAPAPEIWKRIVRVAPIARAELASSWTQRIGFPRPIEATLSREGVGGVRHASFERGVVFIETITRWEPETALAFRIHADPATILPGALDEHVTVGGPYFDVLEGEYRIEPAGPRRSTLYLTSRHRLSTHINAYASLWTDAILRDVQTNILGVIKARCERGGKQVLKSLAFDLDTPPID